MRPKFITRASIDSLLISFDEAKPHYIQGDQDWFIHRFDRERGLLDSRFEFPDFTLDCGAGEATEDEYAATDLENVKRVYDAMRNLPLTVASDARFWMGLSHTYCWDYVRYRRRNEIASGDDRAIKTSYFFTQGAKRSAHVNCLSRLWWGGRMTYDEGNRDNPYALTELVATTAFASNVMLISSSNFTGNRHVLLGILDAIKEQRDSGVDIKRKHFVGATKYLNRMGAITVLDYLDRARVREIISDYFATEEFERLVVN